MTNTLIAQASVTINAPAAKVWDALVTPAAIKQYMFGTTVTTDWREGSPITWKGEFKGKRYEDKGKILRFQPQRSLQYSHFSPLAGLPDKPESYHTVTIDLAAEGKQTRVSLAQDNNPNDEAREHSAKNWESMLSAMKKFVEQK